MASARGVLLETLENLVNDELKRFTWNLAIGVEGFDRIPRALLENAKREDIVDKMVERYGINGAEEITLIILMKTNQNLLAEKLKTKLSRSNAALITFTKEFRMVNADEVLLETLQEMLNDELRIFTWHLTKGVEGFDQIPRSQLENAKEQDIVDKMVEKYGISGAEEITLIILTKTNQHQLAEELNTKLSKNPRGFRMVNAKEVLLETLRDLVNEELKSFTQRLANGVEEFDRIPKDLLENAKEHDIVDRMVERYGINGAEEITLIILTKMNQHLLAEKLKTKLSKNPRGFRMANAEGVLLETLEDLTFEELRRFTRHLTQGVEWFDQIPRSQLEYAHREDIVDTMVEKYGINGAEEITEIILKKINQKQLAEKLKTKLSRVGFGGEEVTGGRSAVSSATQSAPPAGGSSGATSVASKAAFIDAKWVKLVERATAMEAILDELLSKKVIDYEQYSNICSEKTSEMKMRHLILQSLKSSGALGKAVLYDVLMDKQPYMMKDLGAY